MNSTLANLIHEVEEARLVEAVLEAGGADAGLTPAGCRAMTPTLRYLAWWTDPGGARVSAGVFIGRLSPPGIASSLAHLSTATPRGGCHHLTYPPGVTHARDRGGVAGRRRCHPWRRDYPGRGDGAKPRRRPRRLGVSGCCRPC